MKEYYIYEMHELLSPTGKPYVGSSCDFYRRACKHKSQYKLQKRPELIPISGPYYSRKEARTAEQPYRVANGWKSEDELNGEAGKIGGKIGGKHRSPNGGKHTSPNGGKIGGPIVGNRPWINKDGVNKRVEYNELETYLNIGWIRGRGKNKTK